MSDMLRITGMSGMDTDTMVKKMMKPYEMRVDKLKQNRQLVQWRQDLYRDVMKDVKGFTDNYFDVMKKDNYMLSTNSYSSFDVTSEEVGNSLSSAAVTATAGINALEGIYKVENVNLAEKASTKSSKYINCIQGNTVENREITASNNKLSITINNKSYNITLSNIKYDGTVGKKLEDLAGDINKALATVNLETSTEKLSDKLEAKVIDGVIQFNTKTSDATKPCDNISIGGTALGTLGFLGTEVRVDMGVYNRMSSIVNSLDAVNSTDPSYGKLNFSIKNGNEWVDFSYDFNSNTDKYKSIAQVMDEISSKANVNIKYSQLERKFTVESVKTGATEELQFKVDKAKDTASSIFLENVLGVSSGGGFNEKSTGIFSKNGKDGHVDITNPNGVKATVYNSSNIFTVDGMTFNLNRNSLDKVTNITVTSNVQKSFDKIKGFIDKYNELIDKIGKKVEEKKSKGFTPLTDEQKKAMKPEEIEKWESRAKEGLLKSDSNLQNMLTQLRGSFFAGVEGAGMSLTELGLSTSRDTLERGKIVFDTYTDKNHETGEDRLKRVLKEKGDKVAELFIKKSTDVPAYTRDLTSDDRKKRTSQEGILHRINDIFQDYTTTKLDKGGRRGILVEKAGLKGTISEFKNLLFKDLDDKDRKIKEMEKQLITRENKFYMKFAQLEKAMNNMNSQSSWLAQQLGGGK